MRKSKALLWAGTVTLIVLVGGAWFWFRTFRSYPPQEVIKDVRAGLAARPIVDADARIERFLEERYGPLADQANRQKAFLDFFNVEHINGLYFIVNHMPGERKQPSINAMARWIAKYRQTMSPEEKSALNAKVESAAGHAMIKQATARYLSQDVHYRGDTAIVITELLTTLDAVKRP